jgi:hypothetical protein
LGRVENRLEIFTRGVVGGLDLQDLFELGAGFGELSLASQRYPTSKRHRVGSRQSRSRIGRTVRAARRKNQSLGCEPGFEGGGLGADPAAGADGRLFFSFLGTGLVRNLLEPK